MIMGTCIEQVPPCNVLLISVINSAVRLKNLKCILKWKEQNADTYHRYLEG